MSVGTDRHFRTQRHLQIEGGNVLLVSLRANSYVLLFCFVLSFSHRWFLCPFAAFIWAPHIFVLQRKQKSSKSDQKRNRRHYLRNAGESTVPIQHKHRRASSVTSYPASELASQLSSERRD